VTKNTVCHKHKIIYCNVGRTGSETVRTVLQTYFGGQGEKPLPGLFKQYYSFAFIRDPYTRMFSVFKAVCFDEDDRYGFIRAGANSLEDASSVLGQTSAAPRRSSYSTGT